MNTDEIRNKTLDEVYEALSALVVEYNELLKNLGQQYYELKDCTDRESVLLREKIEDRDYGIFCERSGIKVAMETIENMRNKN